MPKIGKEIVCLSRRQRRRLIRREVNKLRNVLKTVKPKSNSEKSGHNLQENTSENTNSKSLTVEAEFLRHNFHTTERTSPDRTENFNAEPETSNSSSYSAMSTEDCEQHSNENNYPGIYTDIQDWAIKSSISQNHLTNLLKILQKCGHDFPCDARTFLKTPKNLKITNMPPGNYYHFGLANALTKSVLKHYLPKDFPSEIKFSINVDGLPLTKSSGSQFWPILTAIEAPFYTEPCVVGIYHGNEKPSDCNDFLQYFVEDALTVCESGVDIQGQKISCKLNVFICDAPAKAYITGTKGHNAYFGCSKCIQEGKFKANRVTYPEIAATLRTDESFRLKVNEEYHKKRSILENLKIGMVSQFPLDYLHLICLGIMKKLLQFWVKGKKNVRMTSLQLKLASAHLVSLAASISKEFARKPRPLEQVDRFKATELRQLLLYTGPIIFREHLDQDKYYHFLSLSVAVRILASEEYSVTLIDYARSLLIYFVSNYSHLYGAEHMSHNVHNLVHICDDVQSLGPLDKYSAFKYENFMQKIKKKVRTSNKPLQQFINRAHEENNLGINPERRDYPIMKFITGENSEDRRLIKSLEYKNYFLDTKKNNNCFLSHDGNIVAVKKIFLEKGKVFLYGKKYLDCKLLFNKPCDSSEVGINTVTEKSYEFVILEVGHIKQKCLKLPMNERESAIFPLVHEISNSNL